jgi:hypothetical protein
MPAVSKIEWEILNATADDWENLEAIYRMLQTALPAPDAPCLGEVADGIRGLVERGLLAARLADAPGPVPEDHDLSYVWHAWFQMTPAGRAAWSQAAESYLPQPR